MNAAIQRRQMILGQIYTNDVIDPRVLAALADVPREPFLPEQLRGAAYVDRALEIAPGRFMMEPLTLAMMLELAHIDSSCHVLNIGCMNGYAAALIAQLAGHVTGVDTDPAFIAQAQAHMKRLGVINAAFKQVASLADGYAPDAPYDVIVIAGAIAFLPEALGAQLAQGGRLVAVRNVATRPGAAGGLGKGLLVERLEQRLQFREHFDASAMLLPGFENDGGFVF